MPKSNITVSRYVDKQLGWEACVRPDDGSWCLFIPREGNGVPLLFHRIGTCVDEHGATHDSFAPVGSPEFEVFIADQCGDGLGPSEAFDASKCSPMPAAPQPSSPSGDAK